MSSARWPLLVFLINTLHLRGEPAAVIIAECPPACAQFGGCAPCDVPECDGGRLRVRVAEAPISGVCCDRFECREPRKLARLYTIGARLNCF